MTKEQPKNIQQLSEALLQPTRQLAEAARNGDLQAMHEASEARIREIVVFAAGGDNQLNELIKRVGGKPLESRVTKAQQEATMQ